MVALLFFIAGLIAYLFSTIAGGGGALLLLPIVGFYLNPSAVAPVVNLGNMIGRPVRLILFWKYINWKIVRYFVPTAILGALLGGFAFSQLRVEWVQFLLGLFLISTVFQFRFGKKKQSFLMKNVYYIPLGFTVTLISTVFGATGPILNPFYLNSGLEKETLVATKTTNSFFAGIAQLSAYSFFGALQGELWWYGLTIGIGAVIGNLIGKEILSKISKLFFRRTLILLMVISGSIMLIKTFT